MREGTARRGQRAVGAARKGRKELAGHGVLGLVFPGPSPQGEWDPPPPEEGTRLGARGAADGPRKGCLDITRRVWHSEARLMLQKKEGGEMRLG